MSLSQVLRPVSIPELRSLEQGKHWQVDQLIPDIESLTPVRGVLQLVHHGTALEVSAEVETILTLCCARCLQQFNQVLRADVRELIDFRGAPSTADSRADPLGDVLDDRLDPQGRFDPERWLFEQLSLRLPLVNRCGDDCPGPVRWSSASTTTDPRWSALKALSAPNPQPPSSAPSVSPQATSQAPTSEPAPAPSSPH
ncbi:MAG: YceD family protein [Cyanobacteriota bacterium]